MVEVALLVGGGYCKNAHYFQYYSVMSYYAYLDLRCEPCAGGPRMRTHCSFVLSVMYGCMDVWMYGLDMRIIILKLSQ